MLDETEEIAYNEKILAEFAAMTAEQLAEFFENKH